MATYQYIGNGFPDGTVVFRASTEKGAFFGTTPVVQPSSASQAAVSGQTTATTTALRTDLDAVIVLANQLRAELVELGLIKGSA